MIVDLILLYLASVIVSYYVCKACLTCMSEHGRDAAPNLAIWILIPVFNLTFAVGALVVYLTDNNSKPILGVSNKDFFRLGD